MVTHRLTNLNEMDMIVVMDAGNIIEQGNHHALLEQKVATGSLLTVLLNSYLYHKTIDCIYSMVCNLQIKRCLIYRLNLI